LAERLNDPNTVPFLRRLQSRLDDLHILKDQNINLWVEAERFWPDRHERIGVLAALFQDTTREAYQAEWAAEQNQLGQSHAGVTAAWMIKKFLKKLRDHFDLHGERNITLLPFSEPINQMAAYHYCVMAELRNRLQTRMDMDPRLVRYLPFLLNYTYEVQTTERPLLRTFVDPGSIRSFYKIKDLYLGYLGVSHFAIPQEKILNLRQFYDVANTNAAELPKLTF